MNAYILSAFVTICVQFHSFRLHYEEILQELSKVSKNNSNYEDKIKAILCEAIHFHILVKE